METSEDEDELRLEGKEKKKRRTFSQKTVESVEDRAMIDVPAGGA